MVESSDTTKACAGSYFGNWHVGGLEQLASMLQTAVTNEVGHGIVVTSLRKKRFLLARRSSGNDRRQPDGRTKDRDKVAVRGSQWRGG